MQNCQHGAQRREENQEKRHELGQLARATTAASPLIAGYDPHTRLVVAPPCWCDLPAHEYSTRCRIAVARPTLRGGTNCVVQGSNQPPSECCLPLLVIRCYS